MKRFKVYMSPYGSRTVRANWFRVRWFSETAVFYRGLRKVAWFENVYSVHEEVE